jgi:hypothetical protein
LERVWPVRAVLELSHQSAQVFIAVLLEHLDGLLIDAGYTAIFLAAAAAWTTWDIVGRSIKPFSSGET